MSIESVKAYFSSVHAPVSIKEFPVSSATVELAAQAAGTEPCRIAKTLSFYSADKTSALLVVTAGDQKIDNKKFKETFGFKARMLAKEDVEPMTGHAPGGVCPFANPEGTAVYLDISMKRFETVFPAAGSGNSAVEFTCAELEKYSQAKEWVDVCRVIET